jgi:hypothetical protein
MEHDRDLKHRIDQAFFNIVQMPPGQREDLRRMWRHTRDLWTKMDIELVNCRRTNKKTPKYAELESECVQTLDTLQGYITWGTLSGWLNISKMLQ